MMPQAVPADSTTVPTDTVPTDTVPTDMEDLPRVPGHPPAVPEDLDYDLPADAIAQAPLRERDRARLLVDGPEGVSHRHVSDLPELLGPGDVVVVNDTRVLPARLRMRRATGGAVEVLLLHERDDGDWEALVRPSRRLRSGEVVMPDQPDGQACVEIRDDLGEGRRVVRVHTG